MIALDYPSGLEFSQRLHKVYEIETELDDLSFRWQEYAELRELRSRTDTGEPCWQLLVFLGVFDLQVFTGDAISIVGNFGVTVRRWQSVFAHVNKDNLFNGQN